MMMKKFQGKKQKGKKSKILSVLIMSIQTYFKSASGRDFTRFMKYFNCQDPIAQETENYINCYISLFMHNYMFKLNVIRGIIPFVIKIFIP